jgi:hypothetical protein
MRPPATFVVLATLGAAACARAPAAEPAPVAVGLHAAASTADAPSERTSSEDLPARRPCPAPQLGTVRPPPAPAACSEPPAALVEGIERALAKDFTPTRRGGRPVVTVACDGLGARVREVSLEVGSPLGIELWRIALDDDGETYHVQGVTYAAQGFFSPSTPTKLPYLKLGSARLPRTLVEPVLDEARAAAAATIVENAPADAPRLPVTVRLCGASYLAIGIEDREGRRVERRNVEGLGSVPPAGQPGLDHAHSLLQKLRIHDADLQAHGTEQGSAPVELRELVAARMLASRSSFAGNYRIAEHYSDLSRWLATPTMLDPLLDALTVLTEERPRSAALDSLAALTGWDARTVDGGPPRTFEEARAAYLLACRAPR